LKHELRTTNGSNHRATRRGTIAGAIDLKTDTYGLETAGMKAQRNRTRRSIPARRDWHTRTQAWRLGLCRERGARIRPCPRSVGQPAMLRSESFAPSCSCDRTSTLLLRKNRQVCAKNPRRNSEVHDPACLEVRTERAGRGSSQSRSRSVAVQRTADRGPVDQPPPSSCE
jgi:hypothetical protein